MKNILIIGASGFIGGALFENLGATNNVYGIGRSNNKNINNIEQVDLCATEEVVDFFKEKTFDVIVHLASVLANSGNLKDPDVFNSNNQMTLNLIKGLASHSSCHFINFSSSAVYPNITGTFAEDDEINPAVNNDCLYGLSKFNSEMLFKYLLPAGITQLHLRVGFVYGENMNPSRIHVKFKEELATDNRITVFGGGKRTIPQIEINSLIKKLAYFIDNRVSGTVNVADENISLADLAQRTIDEYGNEQSVIERKIEGNANEFKLNLEKLNQLTNV